MSTTTTPPPTQPETFYEYTPSLAGGIIAAIVFSSLLFLHLFRLWQKRTWFCIPFSIGALFEVIGYSARAQSSKNPHAQSPFLIQVILILLAPILVAASVYMFLSRIIRSTGRTAASLIRPNLLSWIFVTGDVLCFLLQLVGAAIMGNASSKRTVDLAETIILVGLVVKIVIFLGFLLVGIIFHKRVRTFHGGRQAFVVEGVDWERYLYWLYWVSGLITFRNLFRVIEYGLGDDGYLLSTECPIYVFDAVPMALVLVACNWWYVSIPERASDRSKEGMQLVEGWRGERLSEAA